jgi:adenine-specific DNA-methyltransferase
MHVKHNEILPLDYLAYSAFAKDRSLVLRNRIIWHFEHGAHARHRFSGRYETILWFTKGDSYPFHLDEVRIPQKYPGKRHYKGPRKGEYSGNPLGKNPSDVWIIPNVKAKHIEKTAHPCQFPVAIPQRLVRALTDIGDLVLDPFAGVASSGVAAVLENRRFIGCEIDKNYASMGNRRYEELKAGGLRVRDWDRPVALPDYRQAVAQTPTHFVRTDDGPASKDSKREEKRRSQ